MYFTYFQELRGPRRRQQIDDESEEAGQPISGGAERGKGGRHQQGGQYEVGFYEIVNQSERQITSI